MNFPKELITLRQWICWRLEPDPKSDKPRKVPYDPKTGRKASSTNPESWATLAEAQAAREKFLFTGIGFVFTEECGIVGVDIDHCRNDDGSFTDVAKAILEKAQSYTEVSPSGSGLHILLRGVMPGKGNKNSTSGVEMYAAARYFTMTGNRLEGTPEAIMDGKDILPWIHENYIAKKTSKKAKAKKALRTVSLTDEQVLEKARAAQNGDDFSALWDGSWEGKFGSQSEADLSLCCSLAFWTGKNKEQMDRLFRQSKLFREKWDKVHHANGATYGEETLEQAIARTENVYTPGGELGIYEANGRYIRERGENVYPLTNFTIQPIDMIESEEETQMNCDLVTMAGETYRLAFMTSDFVSSQKFKAILNKRTIALCYMGSDGDLEVLKAYISGLDWKRKRGVKALGLYEHDGRWVFVDKNGAFGPFFVGAFLKEKFKKACLFKVSLITLSHQMTGGTHHEESELCGDHAAERIPVHRQDQLRWPVHLWPRMAQDLQRTLVRRDGIQLPYRGLRKLRLPDGDAVRKWPPDRPPRLLQPQTLHQCPARNP